MIKRLMSISLLVLILVGCSSAADVIVCQDKEVTDFSMLIEFESKDDTLEAYTLKMGFPNDAFSDLSEKEALEEFEKSLGLETVGSKNIEIGYEMAENYIYANLRFKNLDEITDEEYSAYGVFNDYTSDKKVSDIIKDLESSEGIVCKSK